ncbi:TetR/AcrR family transcriptional regulator [Streptomyces sp. NPDC054940]
MATERRTALADAAVTVLAEEGMRGLTHRAVDRAAGLPPGTTSAYYRTRQALLTALVLRLVELDQAELQAAGEALPMPRTPGELTDALTDFIAQRLTGPARTRTLARYICTVESVRRPELRAILTPHDNAAHTAVRTFLSDHGVPDPAGRTLTLLYCVDGLVFSGLATGRRVAREEVEGLVVAALRRAGPV